MDVRAKNRGRPHHKVRFSAAPLMGINFLTQGRPGGKGRECPWEIRTKKFMFVLLFFPESSGDFRPAPKHSEKRQGRVKQEANMTRTLIFLASLLV